MKKKLLFLSAFLLVLFLQLNNVMAYNNVPSGTKSCGDGLIKGIPKLIPQVVHFAYVAIQIAVPVLLIIFGMIDLIKAITAGKEDEIKKAQSTFLRRLVMGALVFFVLAIVKMLISFAGDDDNSSRIIGCMNCLLNNNDSCVKEVVR